MVPFTSSFAPLKAIGVAVDVKPASSHIQAQVLREEEVRVALNALFRTGLPTVTVDGSCLGQNHAWQTLLTQSWPGRRFLASC